MFNPLVFNLQLGGGEGARNVGCRFKPFKSALLFWIVLSEREDPLSLEPNQGYNFPMAYCAADP